MNVIESESFNFNEINTLGFNKHPNNTTVVVAMSGGVDSSVVAAKLKKEGYNVIGITLQLYNHGNSINKKGACCAGVDIADARRIASELNFPHYVLNYESQFKESVIDEFADGYLAGHTPVPCIRCNEKIKFSDMLTTAKELGGDCLATGHYVRRIEGNKSLELHQALSSDKDQSYFLFATTRQQLKFLRFPLGSITSKTETRKLASNLNLKVAQKPDSQDICFVPNGSYAEFIRKIRPSSYRTGEIVDLDDNKIGTHTGIINFTIGQRRGLGIGGGDPLYVVKINPSENKIVVGPKTALVKRTIYIKDVNWLGDKDFVDSPLNGWTINVKVRSTKPPIKASVMPTSETDGIVKLHTDEQGISPGQACVFYQPKTSRVLGGGWITST